MAIHVIPIPSTISLVGPAFTLATANAAGSASTAVASNSELLVFDAVSPATVAASAVVGSATVAARRDHVHIGVIPSAAVFSGNVDLGSNLLVGNAGSTGIAISANGEINMAAQPAFLAYPTSNINNVTGDGTVYNVVFNAEVFDQGADFNISTGVFTAPITGRYSFQAALLMNENTTSHRRGEMRITASNREFMIQFANAKIFVNADGGFSANCSGELDMDSGDTALVSIKVQNGGKGIDLVADSSTVLKTYFSGQLVA